MFRGGGLGRVRKSPSNGLLPSYSIPSPLWHHPYHGMVLSALFGYAPREFHSPICVWEWGWGVYVLKVICNPNYGCISSALVGEIAVHIVMNDIIQLI